MALAAVSDYGVGPFSQEIEVLTSEDSEFRVKHRGLAYSYLMSFFVMCHVYRAKSTSERVSAGSTPA